MSIDNNDFEIFQDSVNEFEYENLLIKHEPFDFQTNSIT